MKIKDMDPYKLGPTQRDLFDYSDQKIRVKVVHAKANSENNWSAKVAAAQIPAKQLNRLPKDDAGRIYSKEYVLEQLRTDPYIFDMRAGWWPKGLTKEAVERCLETGEWHTNAGHFEYVVRGFTLQGGTFEELWKAFEENREKHWRYFLEYAKDELKRNRENRKRLLTENHEPYEIQWCDERIDLKKRTIALYSKLLEALC